MSKSFGDDRLIGSVDREIYRVELPKQLDDSEGLKYPALQAVELLSNPIAAHEIPAYHCVKCLFVVVSEVLLSQGFQES